MKNFLFTTARFDDEEKKYGVTKTLDSFREKISREDYTLPVKDEYKSLPGHYLKLKSDNFRIILTYKDFPFKKNNVRIYVALRVFTRGEPEYDRFKLKNTPEVERDKITTKEHIDWSKYEKNAVEQLQVPVAENVNPDLTDQEYSFISSPLQINHKLFDITIYETKEWIDCVNVETFIYFTEAANNIKDFIIDNLYSQKGKWYVIDLREYAILAFKRQDDNWVLADLVARKEDKKDYDFPTDVPTGFQRGYPHTFLESEDQWREMELEPKSNMVLSSRQVEIVSDNIKYPFFLTGRAGSGKSTLLQYLFAEIILRYIKNRDKEGKNLKSPVYLFLIVLILLMMRSNCVPSFLVKIMFTRRRWRG